MSWLRARAGVEKVSAEEVLRALEAGDACIVLDVRDADEYAEGHVPGSVCIPLSELNERLSELPKEKTIYAICHSGARSAVAVRLLKAHGYQAKNISGGIMHWSDALEM